MPEQPVFLDRMRYFNTFFVLFSATLCGLCAYQTASAQAPDIQFAPPHLYNGKNVVTIQAKSGIERVTGGGLRDITAELPSGLVRGCPKTVEFPVWVDDPVTDEILQLTVWDCDGGFRTITIPVEKWTIKTEYTGPVEIGTDTCLQCRIESSSLRWLDSITVSHPDLKVNILQEPGPDGLYQVRPYIPFRYEVCYTAPKPQTLVDTIFLHFEREFPTGGLYQYRIEKPIRMQGVDPPPPPEPEKSDLGSTEPPLPPLKDPTTFRNIVMPTAVSPKRGDFFYGSYLIAGNLGGYGVTDRFSLLAGAVIVPDFIGPLYLGSIGAKYEFLSSESFRSAVGTQIAFSSTTDSDIRTIAPYVVGSYGNDRHMLSAAVGLGLKRHVTPLETFDRNAWTLAVGGNTTISRGWKLATEFYLIETSGIAPVAFSARKFTESFAFDFGFGLDLVGGSEIFFTDGLQGEITQLAFAPFISGMWVF